MKILAGFLFLAAVLATSLPAQERPWQDEQRIAKLDQRVAALEVKSERLSSRFAEINPQAASAVFFLFGAFCALWAQNTNRNPWLWFFLGAFFNVITIFFLLSKNANDLYRRKIRDSIRIDPA